MTKQQGKKSYTQQIGNVENLKVSLNEHKREISDRAYGSAQNKIDKKLCSGLQKV